MYRIFYLLLTLFSLQAHEIELQVLGSGGPEIDDRASTSYLIWVDGKAKVLVDFGGGAFVRFGEAKAKLEDIDFILFTHFHIDHVADFPALVKAGYFINRTKTIELFGPSKNRYFPDTQGYLSGLFAPGKPYGYMSEVLDTSYQGLSYRAHIFSRNLKSPPSRRIKGAITVDVVAVDHGGVPALAYRVEIYGKSIVFTGDTSAKSNNLIPLAMQCDLLVAHHAISEGAQGMARMLHMPPSRIGQIAAYAHAKKLLLSHRMHRTMGHESESEAIIEKYYDKSILFAEDLQIIPID